MLCTVNRPYTATKQKLMRQRTYLRRKHPREEWDPSIWEIPLGDPPATTAQTPQGTLRPQRMGSPGTAVGRLVQPPTVPGMRAPTSDSKHKETMGDQP